MLNGQYRISGKTMAIKDFVALLIGEGGRYTCSTDAQKERELYDAAIRITELGIKRYKELTPGWTEQGVRDYAAGDFALLGQIKSCLESNGYDTSNLPFVTVPEFMPGLGAIATAAGMGALLLYRKFKARGYDRQNSGD